MFKQLLRQVLCLLLVSVGFVQLVVAQGPAVMDAPPVQPLTWFIKQDQRMVVRRGAAVMVMDRDVTLANGARISHVDGKIELLTGGSMPLQDGEAMNQNGELVGSQRALKMGLTPAAVTIKPGAPAMITVVPVPVTPAVVAAEAPAVVPAPAIATPPAFTYQPAAPVNGKLKGVVELGASGFNSFIIRVDEQRNWKLEKSEYGNSFVMENMATEEDIRTGLKAYIGKMIDFGVAGRDIHFVVSSGAAMSEVTQRITRGLTALKYVVTTVTPEQEGILSLRAVLPPSYANSAFVVDMGSANTKITWLQDTKPRTVDTYGSKYYEKNIADSTILATVKAKASQVPTGQRASCFIIGGVPYELAKGARKGQERHTVLQPYNAYQQLEGAKIHSGLTIYQAIAEATGCQQFVFTYDTPFTIGYLLSLPTAAR